MGEGECWGGGERVLGWEREEGKQVLGWERESVGVGEGVLECSWEKSS